MAIQDKVNQFLESHDKKVNELRNRLQNTENSIQYLQLEIRMLSETELPQAQTTALLEGTGDTHVKKLKKDLHTYQNQLQEALENQIILTNAITNVQVNAGEEVAILLRTFNQERMVQETKIYKKMMHYKGLYVNSMIDEAKAIQEMNKMDTKLQELLVASGRKSQVYSDNTIKSNLTNNNPRFGGTYLALTHQEVARFIQGTYSASDYNYLKKYTHKKDL